MSQLIFWNKQNSNSNNNNNANNTNGTTTGEAKNGNKRNWLHTPEALINGHIVYLVKFFGNLPVEQAKGIEVVKDAIRKLQFAQQMKKAETGTQEKYKKVEITISVDGVAVQEPRTQKILHQFPLHNISYCADEKGIKKFFSFIAKTTKNSTAQESNGGSTSMEQETHECFVFISNKLASDITLTIGQAFDLAYRKYISAAEKTDLGKAQQKISELEKHLAIYKNRLEEISLKIPKAELDALLFKWSVKSVAELPASISYSNNNESGALMNGNTGTTANNDENKLLIDTTSTKSSASSTYLPIVPPRNNNSSNQIVHKSNSQKMDELLLNSDSDSDFDPRADESVDSSNGRNDSGDLFGFEPPTKSYGQQLFYNNNDSKLQNNNNNINMNNSNSSNSFTNEINFITPPLLAPPPKATATRRNVPILPNGNTDLFGSDPFDTNNGNSIFKKQLSHVSVDDFSLESLDPLRK